MTATRFLARMSLDTDVGTALSDTRIRLLEAVEREGSINRAAKAVPLSYKAAWDAIDTMNNLAPEPLMVRVAGGRQGGGTQLTDYGRRRIAPRIAGSTRARYSPPALSWKLVCSSLPARHGSNRGLAEGPGR